MTTLNRAAAEAMIAGPGDRGVQAAAPIGCLVEADLPGRIKVN